METLKTAPLVVTTLVIEPSAQSMVVGAVVKIFKFTAVGEITDAKAGVSTKPADGVLVDLELRA